MAQHTKHISQKSLLIFFLLAYGITWGLSVLATEHTLPFDRPPLLMNLSSILLHYGPALAAIIMVGAAGGRHAIKTFLGRLGQWRAGLRWYLFVFLFPLLVRLVTIGIDVLMGGQVPPFFSAGIVPEGNPVLLLPVVFLAVFFQAGLAEEIGWRGYALPGLQKRYSALTSSLILGVIWTFWHYHPENFSTIWPLTFYYLIFVISLTIIMTWIYNNTQGSLILAVLFHTVSNISDWIIPTFSVVASASGIRPFIIESLLTLAAALVIIVIYGPKYLSHNVPDPHAEQMH